MTAHWKERSNLSSNDRLLICEARRGAADDKAWERLEHIGAATYLERQRRWQLTLWAMDVAAEAKRRTAK